MKKLLTLAAVLLVTGLAFPALALELHAARSAGQIGEKADGYAAALQSDAAVNALVADVNAKRQAEYARIAKEKGQTVDVVAKVAAEQIIGGLEAGAKYQDASGAWKTR
jgi:hypothetical protein